jgi:predicted phage terminase large subunit-like protein
MKLTDKQALVDWDAFKKNIAKETPVDYSESPGQQKARIDRLKSDHEAFCKYYFPHYASSEFAPFHRRFMDKLLKNKRIYMVRKWSRDHAKSVTAGVFAPVLLMVRGELKTMLLASRSFDNAVELCRAMISELEANQRLIHDFGPFVSLNQWEAGKWVTRDGVSIRAIGAGQSPRGTRNQEARPDFILLDDIDDDEVCRNPKRLDQLWEWVSKSLFGTFSLTGKARFVVVNNVIAPDAIVLRASEQADDVEQIDALQKGPVDKKLVKQLTERLANCKEKAERRVLGRALDYAKLGMMPSWPQRFQLMDIAYMVDKMGSVNAQGEYFNDPQVNGTTFKKEWMQFKPLPKLTAYNYPLIAYLDPGFKKTKTSDTKSLVLVGIMNGEYHIHKVFCANATPEEFVDWSYAIDAHVKRGNGAYRLLMEEVFFQSILYKDFAAAARRKGYPVPVQGDTRKKPDKHARIQGIAGYFERGEVFFEASLQGEHHTKEFIQQFISFRPGTRTADDGPDALEGAIFLLQQGVLSNSPPELGVRALNKKRV